MYKKSIHTMIITMISRILGLFRAQLISYYFGSSVLTDAYFSAFKISNFFRQLLGEGALGNTFIPLYNQKIKKDGEESGKEYIFTVLNLVFIFGVIISILMIILSKYIVFAFVSGSGHEAKMLTAKLLRIMSFYFLFISLSGMMGSILNNFGYFVIPASTSIFFNISIIVSAIFFSKQYSVEALAYGVLFGGFLQLIVVLFPMLKLLNGFSFHFNFKDAYVKLLGIKLMPMLVGVFARQINAMIDVSFASYLVGGITTLEYASRIYLLPIGVFGISIANVIFPNLSKLSVRKEYERVNRELVRGLNMLLFLIIPSMFVLTFYSEEVISFIFFKGKFTREAMLATSSVLFCYSLGLYFYCGVHLLGKAYYAMGDNKSPAKYSIISIVINIILNFILIKPYGVNGLAISTSIASMCNFFMLLIIYRKKYIKISLSSPIKTLIKTILSSVLACALSYYIDNTLLKLTVFSLVYLATWSYSFYKKRMDVF